MSRDLGRSYNFQHMQSGRERGAIAYICLQQWKLTPVMPPLYQFSTVRVEEGAHCYFQKS